MAVVLPKDLMVLDNLYDDNLYCGYFVQDETVAKAKRGLREIFAKSLPMIGTETTSLKNSDIPDAVDILNEDEEILTQYSYLIDLTNDDTFSQRYTNVCEIKDIQKVLREVLPCYVEGNAHWLVNERKTGGYYLTVFNHSGIERTVEKGELELLEATTRVRLEVKNGMIPTVCEGNGAMREENGVYEITIPAGGWVFIKF
jgi:hypothetical protein